MSTWQITQKPAYVADFVELNKNLQQAVVSALQELEQDPITTRGNTIKKMKGFTNVYRYRLGDFRLLYAAELDARMIQLLAIGPRSSVYQRFDFPGWDAPDTAVEFGPELAAKPDWMEHPEWFQPEQQEPQKEKLPRKLTPALLTKWRVDPQYHDPLMRCLYEDDLLNIPENKVPPEVLGRVMDGLYPATVDQLAAQPDQVLFEPEDLLRYAEGTLTGFLLRLDKQQEPLTHWALSGPTLVKGGPGSGKSTVALYRLREIVAHHLAETGEIPTILFTTYTNALINASESLLRQLLGDVLELDKQGNLPKEIRITTLHKTAQWIARRSGEKFSMAYDHHRQQALQTARSALQPRQMGDAAKIPLANAIADLRDDYLLAEFDWVIEGQNCQNEADYLEANRNGRGIPFTKTRRQAVWQLYTHYRQTLLEQNLYTWGHLIQFALAQVQSGDFSQRWDYVLVDEAQDLPPAALALAVELCREPSGVFLTADANQSLYNRSFRWGQVHENLNVQGRTRILKRNYRSTRQIAAAAADIMRPVPDFDEEAMVQEYVHVGLPPLIYAASGSEDQARWIGQQIYEAARKLRLPVNAATVLVYSSSVGQPLAEALSQQGLPAKFMNSSQFDLDEPCIKVTTLHAAKGLEFPIVVVAYVEAGRLPRDTEATEPEEIEAHLYEQRRLFFVGCTRAMRHLFITYDKQVPSPFIADLNSEHWQTV
ncbi:MAG: UvrD-helicase domain-containing protein [Ardenticatenaceae bacterium]|nr:UvrD-helicase domain-containing protein [Ardenticatenaceae bacterium]